MLEQLITSDKYTAFQLIMYYLGALAWFTSYILTLRKAYKTKFLEFPILAVSANVVWEFIWGFIFELDFGGDFLITIWRLGFGMDIFIFYAVIKYGKVQVSIPQIRNNYTLTMFICAAISAILIYTYKVSGYDLAMGFNSGMILNVLMSSLALMMFWQMPDRKFSFWIGFTRFLGSDVFFFIYALSVYPDLSFPIAMCAICFVIDAYFLVLVLKRNKALKNLA